MRRPASLLVVDDNEADRDVLSRRLRQRGYAVSMAASGEEALAAIEQSPFDLVLLDVEMPGMSGLDVLAAIREQHEHSQLPVIMVTARVSGADVVEALRLGANDYVTKPIDFQVTVARIETHLALQAGGRRSPRERRAVCARRPGRERRPVGLESGQRPGVLVAALEVDPRSRGGRDRDVGR